jgi:hypothetical protein
MPYSSGPGGSFSIHHTYIYSLVSYLFIKQDQMILTCNSAVSSLMLSRLTVEWETCCLFSGVQLKVKRITGHCLKTLFKIFFLLLISMITNKRTTKVRELVKQINTLFGTLKMHVWKIKPILFYSLFFSNEKQKDQYQQFNLLIFFLTNWVTVLMTAILAYTNKILIFTYWLVHSID